MTTRAGAHPDTLRVLGNLNDTTWLKGADRESRLNEAAQIAYHEPGTPGKFWKIIALLPGSNLADNELMWAADSMSITGSLAQAIVLLTRIKATQQYVWATTRVFPKLVVQSE